MNEPLKVGLVDDHVLLRHGLANLVEKQGYTVIFEADNGEDLINKLRQVSLPDVILLDIKMPQMDGFETAKWLRQHYPLIKVLALSMYDDEYAIIRMLKYGAKGYIVKDSSPLELRAAINAVITKGFYYSEMVTGKLLHSLQAGEEEGDHPNHTAFQNLSEKELQFLQLAATEMTYREIADKMCVSPRTIDGYRDQLFEKLNAKSRVGLVLLAIKNGLVRFD